METRAEKTVYSSPLLGIGRILLWLLLILVLAPAQAVLLLVGSKWREDLPHFFHRTSCQMLGVDVVLKGEMSKARPTLFVSNHMSYLDIMVLGSVVPARFISKAEVARWPIMGWLAKMQRTVFIERNPRLAKAHSEGLKKELGNNANLILFPEGTTSDGLHPLPFKSSLFSVAELLEDGKPLTIQPISLSYTHVDGIPVGRHLMPLIAWYGDMSMGPHLLRVAGLGRIRVQVTAHPCLPADKYKTRKALAQAAEKVVAQGVADSLSGRQKA